MKITISPSQSLARLEIGVHHSVTIEHPTDDLDIYDVERLLRGALVAWGFHPDNVADIFGEDN